MKDNLIQNKSFEFALKIIETYKHLNRNNEYIMSKQLLRSGTSIGANVHEGIQSQSKKDFVAKLSIALKEASETEYWLRLLHKSNYLSDEKAQPLLNEIKSIIKVLTSILKTSRNNMKQSV